MWDQLLMQMMLRFRIKNFSPSLLFFCIYILFAVFLLWVKRLDFNALACPWPSSTESMVPPCARPGRCGCCRLHSDCRDCWPKGELFLFSEEGYLWLKTVLKTWEYWSWFWEVLALNHLMYLNIGFILSFLKDRLPTQKMNSLEGKKRNLISFC